MNERGAKIRLFLTALVATCGGILPASGCHGLCGACFQCAGLGGAMAVLAAIGVTRKKKKNEFAMTGEKPWNG